MKNVIQKCLRIGLMSAALLGGMGVAPKVSLALSEQEILEKLEPIPVFLIVNAEGRALTVVGNRDGAEVEVPIVFMHPNEAQAYIEDAQTENPELEGQIQISIASLGKVYSQAIAQLDTPQNLIYIPSAASLQQASELVEGEVEGVPLYVAVDLQRNSYLFTANNELPMFFSLQDLQSQLEGILAANPELEESIKIGVTSLEAVLFGMSSNNPEVEPLMEVVELVPSSQVQQYIQSLRQQTRQP